MDIYRERGYKYKPCDIKNCRNAVVKDVYTNLYKFSDDDDDEIHSFEMCVCNMDAGFGEVTDEAIGIYGYGSCIGSIFRDMCNENKGKYACWL